ncbi:MAG: glutamate mutase L, partial [Spirochaetes bacterium]|nr:glutamate mutase L [Spirochaetota bacterium]MBU0955087.1 glutamate mutase L [Spirochaetota bacterium]
EPEPRAKRTVEGDLGVFVNAKNIVDISNDEEWAGRMVDLQAMPKTEREKELTRWLCSRAVETGARRHAGILSDLYTPAGKKQIVKGKDLSAVRWVIATGGALTQVEGAADSLRAICTGPKKHLMPPPDARILIDRDYRFSALGTLAGSYPEEVKETFRRWVEGYTD